RAKKSRLISSIGPWAALNRESRPVARKNDGPDRRRPRAALAPGRPRGVRGPGLSLAAADGPRARPPARRDGPGARFVPGGLPEGVSCAPALPRKRSVGGLAIPYRPERGPRGRPRPPPGAGPPGKARAGRPARISRRTLPATGGGPARGPRSRRAFRTAARSARPASLRRPELRADRPADG